MGAALGVAVLVAAAVVGHLRADAGGRAAPRAAFKLIASAGFLLVAALRFVPDRYGFLVAAGLVLSAVGDACLLGRGQGTFLAGIGAFLLAHVAYAGAFAPISRPSAAVAAGLAVAVVGLGRWLWPHLGALRGPVLVYAAAISVMLWLGLGAARPLAPLGAALFFLSDVTVARDRFVAPGLGNRAVGLPLYYAGQLLLACSIRE